MPVMKSVIELRVVQDANVIVVIPDGVEVPEFLVEAVKNAGGEIVNTTAAPKRRHSPTTKPASGT